MPMNFKRQICFVCEKPAETWWEYFWSLILPLDSRQEFYHDECVDKAFRDIVKRYDFNNF